MCAEVCLSGSIRSNQSCRAVLVDAADQCSRERCSVAFSGRGLFCNPLPVSPLSVCRLKEPRQNLLDNAGALFVAGLHTGWSVDNDAMGPYSVD